MATFLATLSGAGRGNWDICRSNRLWGIGRSNHAVKAATQVAAGDELFVWQSGSGLIACATVAAPAYPVPSEDQVPWPEPKRYTYLLQLCEIVELADPVADRFVNYRSTRFGIRTHELQAGFIRLDESVGTRLREACGGKDPGQRQTQGVIETTTKMGRTLGLVPEHLRPSPESRIGDTEAAPPGPQVHAGSKLFSRLVLGSELVPELEVVELSFAHHAQRLREEGVRRVPEVLDIIRTNLTPFGWHLAQGPRSSAGIPVQIAPTGRLRVDGFHRAGRAALWVETGRSWTNNAFLQHMVEAAMCPGIEHVVIAVRHLYDGQPAYDRCVEFAETIVGSGRLQLPYSSLLLIGF